MHSFKLDRLGSRIRDVGRWPERGHWLQLLGTGESTPGNEEGAKKTYSYSSLIFPFSYVMLF